MPDYAYLDRRHPTYDRRTFQDWFAEIHYSGKVQDEVLGITDLLFDSAMVDWAYKAEFNRLYQQSGSLLRQRSQGESDAAYEERAAISRYPMHMAAIVHSFTGGITQVEPRAERTYGDLGDPEDKQTLLGQMWKDLDGRGTNAPALFRTVSNQLSITHQVWYLVEPPIDARGRPRVVLIPPHEVRDWYADESGQLQWVLRRRLIDGREDPKADGKPFVRYWLYTLEGVEVVDDIDGTRTMNGDLSGEYRFPFYTDAERTGQRLPIGTKDLGFTYHVGYRTARAVNYLYNFISDVRSTIRNASGPKLAGDVDDEQYGNTADGLAAGHNLLQGPWDFIGPDPGYVTATHQVSEKETEDVYRECLAAYESQAAQRTATEIRQEQSNSRYSYLSFLSESLDEIETDIFFLVEQIVFPNRPESWGLYTVQRSRDYSVLDPMNERKEKGDIVAQQVSAGASREEALIFAGINLAEYTEEVNEQISEAGAIRQDVIPVNGQ